MRLTTLLVDDEPLAREGLRVLLSRDPDVALIEEVVNGREAVTAIRKNPPDLVFLDVQMPEMDGFSVVRDLGPENMPAVIFVTAYEAHALEAFEINAVDYLLKPVIEVRFLQALARAKQRLGTSADGSPSVRIHSLLEAIATPHRFLKRLAVRSDGRTIFVETDEVEWIEAAENYVQLNCGGRRHLIHITMNALEKSLDPEVFLRIQRSTIVNVHHITAIQPAMHGEYIVTLRGGARLRSGRTYHERMKALGANTL